MSCFACSKRQGLTLIEVVAAIGLVSTLLVTTVVAFSRASRQIRQVEARDSAIVAADQLIAEWFTTGKFPDHGETGEIGNTGFQFRITRRPSGLHRTWQAEILTVEVLRDRSSHPPQLDPPIEIELLVSKSNQNEASVPNLPTDEPNRL